MAAAWTCKVLRNLTKGTEIACSDIFRKHRQHLFLIFAFVDGV